MKSDLFPRRSVHGFGGVGCLPFPHQPASRRSPDGQFLGARRHPPPAGAPPRHELGLPSPRRPVRSRRRPRAGGGPHPHARRARAARPRLAGRDLLVTVGHLGEDVTDAADAMATREAYVALLDRLDDLGLAHAVEVSVKLSAVGQALPGDGGRIALDNPAAICAAAARAGTTVTLDMEDHTTVDST